MLVLVLLLTLIAAVHALPTGIAHLRHRSLHHHIAMRADSDEISPFDVPHPITSPRVGVYAPQTLQPIARAETFAAVPPPAPSATQVAPPATGSASPAPAPPPPGAGSGNPKFVVAHHMVGNTFPYKVADWLQDINLAHSAGIDGFALNIGPDDWMPSRVADAYEAARQSGTDFKLFISFDMATIPCNSANNAQYLRNYITTYANHPNQFRYRGRVFASTFAGQTCNFGQGSVPEGWATQFARHPELTGQNAIFFVPSFFVDPQTFNQFAEVMDGDFNWNSGWPIQVTTQFATSMIQSLGSGPNVNLATNHNALTQFVGSTTTDDEHISGLRNMPNGGERIYMGAVSPWFFTHYSPQTFNKNFVYLSDDHLYARRWESIISERDKFDIVEIITWNDYGESHYIGPIAGAQPGSQAWVDGFEHTGWLEATRHYATAFKTGAYPPVEQDHLVMWARPHMANANAPDPIGPPQNFQLMTDNLWALAITREPSNVQLNGQTFSVDAGVTKLSVKLSPGDAMTGSIVRGGQQVAVVNPPGYSFTGAPPTYNFNAFVAASS